MKKKYINPRVEVIACKTKDQLLTVSAWYYGIGYGGVDTEGEQIPASRTLEDFFNNMDI